MYQTHVFAPPVTGAPTKKGKPGSTAGISIHFDATPLCGADNALAANGSAVLHTPPITTAVAPPPPPSIPTTAVHQSVPAAPPAAVPHPHTPYPPINTLGQRICRQCGLVGRYKDGKCVEKWGPGTVCDRCREKMNQVERRGTLESRLIF